MECYRVVFLSPDPNDSTVYACIDFGTNKFGAYIFCIAHDWEYNGMILDIHFSYDYDMEV